MDNAFKVKNGLNIGPSTATASAAGDIVVDSADSNKAKLHNGTSASAVVTAAHSETLTNKSIDADSNTITNIKNADIKAAAAIALSKLAATTASRALVSDGSGVITPATTTSTEIGYVNGVTSAIQTQLDAKQTTTLASGKVLVGNGSNVAAAVTLTGDVTNDNAGVTAIGPGKVTNAMLAGSIAASKLVGSDIATVGTITSGTWSGTAVAETKGGTNQTTYTTGDLLYASASNTLSKRGIGSSGDVLTVSGGVPTWSAPAAATIPTRSYEISNLGLSATVAANALTIALKQADGSTNPASGTGTVYIGMRSSTAGTGGYSQRTVTSALSVTVSSGSTLGSTNGNPNWVYVYAIDNAGTIELAVAGSRLADDGSLVSTTAEGGAGAADSKTTLYSTTARSNVACRLIGRIKSTQATAGTWATTPSEVSLWPFEKQAPRSMVHLHTGNGYGSTNTKIARFSTVVTNIGTAITYADSASNGASFTINEDGVYALSLVGDSSAVQQCGWSLNSSQLTTSVQSITTADALQYVYQAGGEPVAATWIGVLSAGDVVRPHAGGAGSFVSGNTRCTVTKVSA